MRAFLIVFAIVVLAVVGVGAYLYFNLGALIKQAIETEGPAYLEAPVTVQAVNLGFADTTGEIRGFQIANPAGFDGPYAMRVARVKLALDQENSSQEVVVLNELSIDGAELNAVAKGTRTNLQQLLANVERNAGAPSGDSTTEGETPVRVIIDQLHFTNAKTQLVSDLLGEVAVEIPDIHLSDIGRKSNGATMGEVFQLLLKPISQAVTREVVARSSGIDELEQRLKDKVKDKLGGLGDLLNR